MSAEHGQDAEKSLPRKPYTKPKLEEYGNIRDITANVANTSPNPDPPPHAGARFRTA